MTDYQDLSRYVGAEIRELKGKLSACETNWSNEVLDLTATIESKDKIIASQRVVHDQQSAEVSELRQLCSDYWQAMDIYDEDSEEWQDMHHKVRLVVFDTASGSPKSEPTIIWMDGDDSWNKCSECDAELIDITCEGENGQRLECETCGHQWWEGEYIKPTADDSIVT